MRFGLFGTGFWAEQTHGAALVAHDDVDLVGVWGRDPAKTQALAERLGTRPYDEVSALVADVDAVAVALPPDVQAAIAVEAADAGRHLLLDKPLSLTVADADRVVEAVDSRQVASRVFFTARFSPETERWLQELAEAGDWDGGHVSMLGNIYLQGSPYAGSVWRRERGALWDIAPHALSQLVPVLGPVTGVVAGAGAGDTVHLVFRHDSGASSTATLSLTAPPAAAYADVHFYGAVGRVTRPPTMTSPVAAFGNAIDELLGAIDRGETADRCDVRFGREVVAVLADAEAQLR